MTGDQEIGKPVGFRRFAKKRQAFEQTKAIHRSGPITRPRFIKHELAYVEVKTSASVLPPATRQFLAGLEHHVGR